MKKNSMMTDGLMTEDNSDEAVDENQNYFCKHYKPSKKEDLNVRFNIKQNQVKFITVENDTMDTMQVQRNKIESFETYDQINEQIDILLLKLEELSKRKIEQGYDVSYDFDLVKFQVNVLKKQKEKIEQKEQEMGKHKKQMEAENKLKQENDKRYEMENETKKKEKEYQLKIELDYKARKEQDREKKVVEIKIEKVNDEDDNKFGIENEKEKVIHVNKKKNVKELNVKDKHDGKDYGTIKDQIFDYLEHSIASKNLDIFFLFHDDELDMTNLKHLKDKLDLHSAIRFAFGFYDYKRKIFKMINFGDFDCNSIKVTNIPSVMDIRKEFVNLEWRNDSISLVLNLTNNLNSKLLKNFEIFFYKDDQVRQLLDHKEIFFISSEHSYWNISSQAHLCDLILNARLCRFNRRISYLKRFKLNSFTEVQQALNRHATCRKLNEFASKIQSFVTCSFESFEKITLYGPVELKKSSQYDLKLNGLSVISSYGVSLMCCEKKRFAGFSNIFYWVEIFESQEILNQILDINLTAGFVVDEFNKKCKDCFIVPKMVRIRYQDYFIGGLEMNLEIEKCKIKFLTNQEMLECLTHFSYEYSKKQFILKDLRPLNDNDKILLTEPVIFSCFSNIFGSSDMGEKAINKFKDEHECSNLCHQFNLGKLK